MAEKYSPQEIEQEMLNFWNEKGIYKKAKLAGKGKEKFYFLDGPPYTSGKIHIGIAWNKSLKDCVLRYKRMRGFDVWDRAGYDMHGLPTEHKAEEKLGIKNKDEIPKFGVEKFIKVCRDIAVENMKMMSNDFKRLGVWMDFDNAYQSIKNEFMEGEWWLIKKAYENKRLYEGRRTMHWCSHCATALAKHELEYKNIKDDSVFVKFKVKGKKNEYLVIWTTTPWTLAFNLGVMANPEIDYIKAKVGNEVWILAKGLAGALIQGVADKKFEVIEELKGEKLSGLEYEHPWSKDIKPFADIKSKKLHTIVLSKEYVDLSAGSGLVHMAPGCGPEDYEVGHKEGLPPFNNINEYGVFPKDMGRFSGLTAKKDDKQFRDALGKNLIATTEVEHEYAHCWRCHKPVVFRTTEQWFFRIEDLKEEMRELNKKIFWQPEWAGSRQFDSWLDNLRDNSITRQRYWGTPLPIWKCGKCGKHSIFGSVQELKKKAKKVPDELHRPWIDAVEVTCSCGGKQKRIPDILDVWIDAGTTSWTCLDFPQRNDLFKKWWPAAFILEGKDQIRGWFNLLFVASMVSMNKPSYKSVYMHGFVQDALGRKMSKSLGNIISPYEVIDKYGADSFRYYAIGGANPGLDLNYDMGDMKIKNKNLVVLWNLHNYLLDLAANSQLNPEKLELMKEQFSVEERYIFSKLNSAIKKATGLFESCRLNEVPLVVEELFLELSRTYIQLIREKISDDDEKKIVIYTTYNILMDVLKLFSPIAPFITEKMYLNLKEAFNLKEQSVHLCKWPECNEKLIDHNLERSMEAIQPIVQSILSAREKMQLGVRWPLGEAAIVTKDEKTVKAVEEMKDIIKKQTNIREIDVQESMPGISVKVRADFKQIEPDFKDKTAKIIAKLSIDSPETILRHIEKDGKYTIKIDCEEINIVKEHLIITRDVPKKYQEAEFRNGFVYLSREISEELEAEGYAREVMRRVQALRKKAGLEKKDRIALFIKADEELKNMLSKFESQIKEKVGAEKIIISELDPGRKHNVTNKEKVKNKSFEIFFDKI